MRKLDPSRLLRGDIILTTSPAPVSKAIRTATKADISHAMLVVQHSSVIDSTGEGVQARNLQRMFYEDENAIYALRLKAQLSEEGISIVIDYARSQIGTRYSLPEAVRSIRNPTSPGNEKQFCSRLVAQSFARTGVLFVPNPDYCRPEQLLNSPLLIPVSDAIVEVTGNDRRTASLPDATVEMRDKTNKFLESIRQAGHIVESIDDALRLVMSQPALDGLVADSLENSGYLEHWKVEMTRNAYRYNVSILQIALERGQLQEEDFHEEFRNTLREHRNGDFDHWQRNEKTSKEVYEATRLRTFRLLANLYATLAGMHRTRIEIAEQWLKDHGDMQ